jgi:hypothetical protein
MDDTEAFEPIPVPDGQKRVKCPVCDYTIDVPEELESGFASFCERCAVPKVTHVLIQPADIEAIIEVSVSSACAKVAKDAEASGRTDYNLAEIGAAIARETIGNTLHHLAADEEVSRAGDLISARLDEAGLRDDDGVVEAPDDGE